MEMLPNALSMIPYLTVHVKITVDHVLTLVQEKELCARIPRVKVISALINITLLVSIGLLEVREC
jgi:hypothetical protein